MTLEDQILFQRYGIKGYDTDKNEKPQESTSGASVLKEFIYEYEPK